MSGSFPVSRLYWNGRPLVNKYRITLVTDERKQFRISPACGKAGVRKRERTCLCEAGAASLREPG